MIVLDLDSTCRLMGAIALELALNRPIQPYYQSTNLLYDYSEFSFSCTKYDAII